MMYADLDISLVLDHHWTAASRTAVFLCSFCFLFSAFGTNFGANSIPFGADMTGLFPKYLTIRRGQVLCAILGVAVVPWKLLTNAKTFLSFLGSYNIFMAPLCAVILVDYAFTRKGNIHVPSLYDGSKGGLYWFWSGVNWLGVFAWCGGVAMGLPGLVATYQPHAFSKAGQNMYRMGWILTFITASVIYFALTFFIKPQIFPNGTARPVTFEYLAKNGREGFFEGERGEAISAPGSPTITDAENVHIPEKGDKVSI